MKKRVIALALCLVMLLTCLGMSGDALKDSAPLYDRLIAAQTAEEFDAIAEAATEEELSALTDDQLVEISNRYAAILGEDAAEPITYVSSNVNDVAPLAKKDTVQVKSRLARVMAADVGQKGPFEPSDAGHEGLFLNKNVSDNVNGTYKITLESFVTGNVKITQQKLPADIVLVLDVSGSMDDHMPFANSSSDKEELWRIINSLDKEYGKTAGIYKWGSCDMRYKDGKWQWKPTLGYWKDVTEDDMYGNQTFYIKKIYALKTATKDFIDQVEDKAAKDGVDHTISIVTFSNSSSIISEKISVTSEGAATLRNKIDALSAGGGTQAGKGMDDAHTIISNIRSDRKSNKVVVMFTDGEPGDRGFNPSWPYTPDGIPVANDAIATSNKLKNNYDTTVYTIGVFGTDTNASNDKVDVPDGEISKYMHYVSSNFKSAKDMDTPGTPTYPDDPKNYFLLASNASEMTDIFGKISEEISGGAAMQLGSETVMRDIVTNDFKLVSTDVSSVNVYTAEYLGYEADGTTRKFAERDRWEPYTASVEIKGNTVEVKGFAYSSDENCVKDTTKNGNTTYSGRKLIVEFDIKVSDSCQGGGWFDTNTTASAIYDKDGKLVGAFPVPNVNVPRKTFDLTIRKSAADDTTIDPNQTFVFNVVGTDQYTNGVNTQVIVQGASSVTLKDLPVGEYTVTEDTSWSWRYTPTDGVTTKTVPSTTDAAQTVTFVNELTNDHWLNFLNRVTNIFGQAKAS